MKKDWLVIIAPDGRQVRVDVTGYCIHGVHVLVGLNPDPQIGNSIRKATEVFLEDDEAPTVAELEEQWKQEPYNPC